MYYDAQSSVHSECGIIGDAIVKALFAALREPSNAISTTISVQLGDVGGTSTENAEPNCGTHRDDSEAVDAFDKGHMDSEDGAGITDILITESKDKAPPATFATLAPSTLAEPPVPLLAVDPPNVLVDPASNCDTVGVAPSPPLDFGILRTSLRCFQCRLATTTPAAMPTRATVAETLMLSTVMLS